MMATVGSEFQSPLTLSNITTFWNGSVIRCVVNNGEIVNQPQPFAMLIVNGQFTSISFINIDKLYTVYNSLLLLSLYV